jgi:hypothetical protein
MAAVFLILLASYLALGFVFALAFVCFGAGRIDPHAAHGTWGFRLLIIPGAAALWPLLLSRWLRGVPEPPEQRDPHRRAAAVPRSALHTPRSP